MLRTIITVVIIFCAVSLWSQGIPNFEKKEGNSISQQDSLSSIPDSIVLRYYKIDNLDRYYTYTDSALDVTTHNYDPSRLVDVDYIHLGNQGSAAAPLRFEVDPQIGFTEGHKQYDLYRYDLTDFKFYEANVPLVNASFSPMGSQDNFVITADFTRTFSDGFTVSSNYRRVNQAGLYTDQQTKITNFGVSIRYDHPGKRYTGFLSMISNVADEDNNGGTVDSTGLAEGGIGNREIVTTILSGANTRHQQKYYSLINYYKLNSKYSNLDLLARYDVGYDTQYYKYSDSEANTAADSLYYDGLENDFRGLRHYTRVNKIQNAFYLYLSDKKQFNIRAGIVYDRYSIEQDVQPSSYDNVYLDLDGIIPITKKLNLISKGQIGIGDGVGDFNLDGAIDINIGKIGTLRGGMKFYRQSPSLLQDSFYITRTRIWPTMERPELLKPVGSEIYGSLTIPYLNLQVDASQHVLNNPIYFDQNARPIQSSDNIYSATVFTIKNNVSWSIFNLDNTFLFQVMNENIYGLPSYWSKHNFYLEFSMFKKNLLSRWGVETRISPEYDGLAYNSAIGTFYQSGEQTTFYPLTDVYFSGKVKKFKVFVKLENLNQLIDKTKLDYRVKYHPQQDWTIRFGVSWLFLG